MKKIVISLLFFNSLALLGADTQEKSGVACPLQYSEKDLENQYKEAPVELTTTILFNAPNLSALATHKKQPQKTLSGLNTIIQKGPYILKLTGRSNHLLNQLHTNGCGGQIFSDREYQIQQMKKLRKTEEENGPVLSYQTASRAFGYALLSKVIKENNLNNVAVPVTYACLIDHKNRSFNNKNCVVVQEFVEGEPLDSYLKKDGYLSPDAVAQLTTAVIGGAVWEPQGGNIIVNKKDNKLYFVDLEQPNNLPRNNFAYSDPANGARRYNGNIQCGITDGLLNLFKDNNEALKTIIKVVDIHPTIKSSDFNAGYKKQLINALDKLRP